MFNVRVYGILIKDNNELLLSYEFVKGNYYTKFPGGGLEMGEGTRDCLKREFEEEMNISVEIGEHFYTTDFYQQSAFNANDQIISIYYMVSTNDKIDLEKINSEKNKTENFRFINLQRFSVNDVSLPIDKVVAMLIIEKLKR